MQEMRRGEIIRKTIELGRLHGFVTFDQLNEWMPAATTTSQDIEAVMNVTTE